MAIKCGIISDKSATRLELVGRHQTVLDLNIVLSGLVGCYVMNENSLIGACVGLNL